MTINFTNWTTNAVASGAAGGSGAENQTWSHTVPSATNQALLVLLSVENAGTATAGQFASVTWGGVALTLVDRATVVEGTTGTVAIELWRLDNPTPGTANIVTTGSTTASTFRASACASFNVNAGGAITLGTVAKGSTGTDGTTNSLNVTTTGAATILGFIATNVEYTQTPTTSGQTLVGTALSGDGTAAAGMRASAARLDVATASTNAMAWSQATAFGRVVQMAIPLYESGGTPTPTPGPTLTLTDIDQGRIIQRTSKAAGTGSVPVAVAWTGTTPASLEARVMKGATVIKDWTAVTGFAVVGSGASGLLTSVAVGDGYDALHARTKDSGGTVLATAVGVNTWGIGKNGELIGSSTPTKWFTDSTVESPNALCRKYKHGVGWSALTGAAAIKFANDQLGDEPGVPIGLIDQAVSGSTLALWYNRQSGYNDAVTAAQACGIEFAICHVGSNDARNEATGGQATHESRYRTLASNLRSDLGLPNLPFIIMGCQRAPLEPSSSDSHWTIARAAEMNVAADANNYLGSVVVDLPIDTDNVHLSQGATGGNATNGLRTSRAVRAGVYGLTGSYKGPKPLSATYNATTGATPVTFDLQGGTAITGRTAVTGITGFRYSTDGTTWTVVTDATVTDTNKVTLALPAGLSGVQIDYLAGANPVVTNCVFNRA